MSDKAVEARELLANELAPDHARQFREGIEPKFVDCQAALRAIEKALSRPDGGVREAGLRPEVAAFAALMEQQLRANDHKAGWENDAPGPLLGRVFEEAVELRDAMLSYPRDTAEYREQIGKEAADVANMAMMVADVCGCLIRNLTAGEDGTV